MLMKIMFARFSVSLERFRGAQIILKELYKHQPLPESTPNVKANILQPVYKYRLLSSKIRDAIIKQVDQKNISQSVADEFMSMYDPNKGTQFGDWIKELQLERFVQAKNNSGSYPFFSGSALMSVLMRRYYKFDESQEKFFKNQRNKYGEHFVGTPGLGKTFKFLQLVYLHNLRVKHIIEQGVPQQLHLFQQNFKFVYFNAETSQQEIILIFMTEIEKDFGKDSKVFKKLKDLSEKQINLFEFFKNLKLEYGRKKIQIRFIIDQVNNLYSSCINPMIIKEYIYNWNFLLKLSGGYGTLVSSKNNKYLKDGDPVHQILGLKLKQQRINIIKIVLDNLISPVDRLLYSAQSLLFELEKQNVPEITNKSVFSIVKKLENKLPFLTHYAISKAVTESIKQYMSGKDFQTSLSDAFWKNKDKNTLLYNIKQFNNNFDAKKIEQIQQSISIMSNLMSFSSQAIACQQIDVDIETDNPDNIQLLNIRSKILSREISKKEQQSLLKLIQNTNFFFMGTFNNEQRLFFSHNQSQLQPLRLELMNYFTVDFQNKLIKHMPKQAQNLLSQRIGQIFEMIIFKAFDDFKRNNRIVKTIIKLKNGQQFPIDMNKSSIPQWTFPSLLDNNEWRNKQTRQTLRKFIISKSCFLRAADGNPAFDFLISTFENGNLKLFFVDLTTKNSNDSKKNNQFIRFLSGKKAKTDDKKDQSVIKDQIAESQIAQKLNLKKDQNRKDKQTQLQNIQKSDSLQVKDTTQEEQAIFLDASSQNRLTSIIKKFDKDKGIKYIQIYYYILHIKSDQTTSVPPASESQIKKLTDELEASSVFSQKVKVILTRGFINDDFFFQAEPKQSELSSKKIVQLMKPALKHHQNIQNLKKQGKK